MLNITRSSWANFARLLGLIVVVAASTSGAATNPVVLRLSDGNNAGPIGANTGPGAEQATVTTLAVNGTQYVVTVWMSSQVSEDDRPYQCKCTSVAMDPLSGPTVVANAVQLTDNDGNRPCNHPKIASNGKDILWAYGTNDPNRNNVQAYVQGLDHMCNTVTDRLRISNNNGNDGAPDISFSSTNIEGMSYWVAGYLENNERSRVVGLTTTGTGRGMTITETFDNVAVDPANIGRPSLARFSADRTLFCSANGNNRPPELGVRCVLVDSITGEAQWSELIAASDPQAEPRRYFNQPQVAVGDNGRMFVQVEQSNGAGRDNADNRTGRGSTRTHIYTLLPNDEGPRMQAQIDDIGLHQVHASVCAGGYGPNNALHLAVFDASITGSGLASAQLATFDVPTRALMKVGRPLSLGAYNGDSGYLANLYGQNPNNQGRDFMRCIGDVPNPGFGVEGGNQPEVSSYFVFAYAGRVGEEEKNSLFVSFLPANVPVPVEPVQHALTVQVLGDGMGRVDSSPLGLDGCTQAQGCVARFDAGTVVSLVATPAEGSTFVSWAGDCTGAAECSVRLGRDANVTATFTRVGTPLPGLVALTVDVVGSGTGQVTSSPAGIECTSGRCAANFARNTPVTLTAVAGSGADFVGWTGACMGTQPCLVTMDVARSVAAQFNRRGDPTPPGSVPGVGPSLPGTEDAGVSGQADGQRDLPSHSGCQVGPGRRTAALWPAALLTVLVLRRARRRN